MDNNLIKENLNEIINICEIIKKENLNPKKQNIKVVRLKELQTTIHTLYEEILEEYYDTEYDNVDYKKLYEERLKND